MKIPLFDLDRTILVSNTTYNNEHFVYAIKTVYGIDIDINALSLHRMIDKQILVEFLKIHNISEEKALEKIEDAVSAMRNYFFANVKPTDYSLLPGVIELLQMLKKKGSINGILTGNVEEIAWKKLELLGVKDYFDFGSFGNLAYKRVDLIPIAKERAEKKLQRPVALKELVIVGDTPLDIACAKAGGIESIGVASGVYSVDELEKAGADLVIQSLKEQEKILQFLEVI